MVIILQHIQISNHDTVYLELIQLYTNYILIKLVERRKAYSYLRLDKVNNL